MAFRYIDMSSYPRRAHFDYFRSLPYPYAGTTVNLDVSPVLAYHRRRGRSFYLSFLHAAALAADGVPELRQRIRDGAIVEYDRCPTSHVEMGEDGVYHYCTLRHHMDDEAFYAAAEAAREACRGRGLREDEESESMYFISSVPWLHYTALIQPVAGGDESNPRITWGKYEIDGAGRTMMPVSILVHHGLADGIHIARFYRNLEAEIGKFTEKP